MGNATTGLYLAIAALGLHGKRVAIPNSVCPHVPLAVLLSGNTPIYLDVTYHDLGLDIEDLIRSGDQVEAVIAVHAYGSVCNIRAISSYCKSRGIPLIEDLAVSQGASLDGQPVGSFSDIAVLSFGAGKIVNAGHGGAILTSRLSIFSNIVAFEETLNDLDSEAEYVLHSFGQYHTSLYNRYYGSGINFYFSEFKTRALGLRKHILCRFNKAYQPEIELKVEKLHLAINLRQSNSEMLESLLVKYESDKLEIFRPSHGSVNWRFNLLIDGRDDLLRSMLSKGIKVSSWFPSVDLFFEDRSISCVSTSKSDRIGDRLLNLWINDEIDTNYLIQVAGEVASHVKQIGEINKQFLREGSYNDSAQ